MYLVVLGVLLLCGASIRTLGIVSICLGMVEIMFTVIKTLKDDL